MNQRSTTVIFLFSITLFSIWGSAFVSAQTTSNDQAPISINCGGPVSKPYYYREFIADTLYQGDSREAKPAINVFDRAFGGVISDQRVGSSFNYKIPVKNGQYKVSLYFAEIYWGVSANSRTNGAGRRKFNVNIEGTRKLTEYEIFAKAGGENKMISEAFDVLVNDGVVNIDFLKGSTDIPAIAGIEVEAIQRLVYNPVKDATVRAGSYSKTNFGTDTKLEVKASTEQSFTRQAYLQFDIRPVEELKSAKIRVYGTQSASVPQPVVILLGRGDYEWFETRITWGNKPPMNPPALSTASSNQQGYFEFDVTELAKKVVASIPLLNFVLVEPAGQNAGFTFNSRESATNPPELILEGAVFNAFAWRIGAVEEAEPAVGVVSSTVYPNPASGTITIKVSDRHSKLTALSVTNLTGINYPLNCQQPRNSSSEVTVTLPERLEGIYLLNIHSDKYQEVIKILVSH